MNCITLSSDLERFAAKAVASDQYGDAAEIVRTGLDLVRRRDTARAVFLAPHETAQRDGELDGFSSLDDVRSELDGIIAEENRAQA